MKPYEIIVKSLRSNDFWFEEIRHEPVYTSEQAAAVRGLTMEQGAKSLLFKAKLDYVLVVVPGDKKVIFKKLKNTLLVKDIRFATPEEVKEQMGVEVGACYPFGNVADLRTLVDKSLAEQEIVSCNPGRHDISIKFKFADYQKLVQPELAELT